MKQIKLKNGVVWVKQVSVIKQLEILTAIIGTVVIFYLFFYVLWAKSIINTSTGKFQDCISI